MKKIVSLFLIFTLLLTMSVGCNKNKNTTNTPTSSLSGEEIAKLLLANERLDSSVLGSGTDIIAARNARNYLFSEDYRNSIIQRVSASSGTCSVSGNTYSWSDFGNYCNIKGFFSSYEANIIGSIESACSLIDMVKRDLQITNKWLKSSPTDTYQFMLKVDENSEALFESMDECYMICKRYTNSLAQNVYEMYQYDYATANSYHFTYIKDHSYEYVSKMNNVIDLCVKGEKVGDSWTFFYCVDIAGHCNSSYVVANGDISYLFDYMINNNAPNTTELTIIDGNMSADILKYNPNGTFTIYPGAFTGIKALQVTTTNVTTSMDNRDADILFSNNVYTTVNAVPSIILSNGNVLNVQTQHENMTFEEFQALQSSIYYRHGNVSGSIDGYHFELIFNTPTNVSLSEQFNMLNRYLTSNGIACKYNYSNIVNNAVYANAFMKQFLNSYTINEMPINNYTNAHNAMLAYEKHFTEYANLYESVKNYEVVILDKESFLISNYNFTSIQSTNNGNISIDGENITVSDLSLTLNNLLLIDSGTSYTIKLALAAKDESGKYDACQIRPLPSENIEYTSYNSGESFTLKQNATFSLNCFLNPGKYDLIGFISTSNDIRVSEFFTIISSHSPNTSYTVNENEFKINADGSVTAFCNFDYNITNTLEISDSFSTYNDVYNHFLCVIANYGIASNNIEIQNADDSWSTFNSTSTVMASTLRMAYTYTDSNNESKTAYYTLTIK
ncbi:MAG: hypothetical protein E7252_01345 [Lachnospira sp.]|nr:hypothetical protein [Lachnospira sp.]